MRLIRTLWMACIGTVLLFPVGASDEGDDEAEEEEEESEDVDLSFTVGPGCVESTSSGQVSVNSGSCLQIVRGSLRDAEQCDVWFQPSPITPTSSSSSSSPRFGLC